MLNLETVINKTAAYPDLIGVNSCFKDDNIGKIPKDDTGKETYRWSFIMVDGNRIKLSKTLHYAALNALHFGHLVVKKICNVAATFQEPNKRENIETKSKKNSARFNTGKKLLFQLPQTKQKRRELPKTPSEEIQLDFTGNLPYKNLASN